MTPLSTLAGPALSVARDHCDTDAIFPARHMKTLSRAGLGRFAFEGLRAAPASQLDDARWRRAVFLVTGWNFGCGSSREHAVWAIADLGVRVIIAKSFADIFAQNAAQNGIATVMLPASDIDRLYALADAGVPFAISLEDMELTVADETIPFELEGHLRKRLLAGLDEVEETERSSRLIEDKERALAAASPWMQLIP